MTLRSFRAAVVALAALVSCGCAPIGSAPAASAVETSGARATTGTRATDFATTDVHGRTVRLSDYLGKEVILIDFWATYCTPCLAEMPHLERIYEEERDKGFVVLAVSMDGPETEAEVPSFAARNGLQFPVLLDGDSHVTSLYNPKTSAPLSVLIDRAGNVVRVREGYNPGDEELVAGDVRAAVAGEAR